MKNLSNFDLESIRIENFNSKIIDFLNFIEPYYVLSLITLGIVGNLVSFLSRLKNKYKYIIWKKNNLFIIFNELNFILKLDRIQLI